MKYKLDFRTYSDALKKNQLLGLKCRSCGNITCPPTMVCRKCASFDQEVIQLSGTGKIKTFTTTYVAPMGREVEAPYTIVMVALDEGPWISGNLIDIDPARVDMNIIGCWVMLGNKVFPGDCYSSGEAARPLFSTVRNI
ncbi:MAG: nucleic acid-binding protein [Desulfobacterium sp.]|nr:nucleic acid-binding protein [Desulfobacterium sp.]